MVESVMKELFLSLERIEWESLAETWGSLADTLISLLLVITGLLGVIAIQGHTLTVGKNVEQRTLALLALDSVEETMLAMGNKGMDLCKKDALKRFHAIVTAVDPYAQLTLPLGCPAFVRGGTNVFAFQVEWQELSSFAETYNLTPNRETLSRKVSL